MPLLKLAICMLLGLQVAFACTCVNTGSYCSGLRGTEIVFFGRVTEDSGEGHGKGPAKMAVEEVLHGMRKDIPEVIVDTHAGTSCYMRLQKDERYVIYGSAVANTPNRVARNACSFSFLVAGNETLLSALRGAEAGDDSRLVGKVRMKYEEYGVQGDGAAGVRVVASGPKTRMEAVTNGNGEFEFLNVLPGKYHFEVSSPNVFEDKWRWPSEDPLVPPSGCGYQNLYVWPDGRIAGTVRGSDGKPLDGITVQAFAKNARGELNSSSLREQKTNDKESMFSEDCLLETSSSELTERSTTIGHHGVQRFIPAPTIETMPRCFT